MSVLEVQIQQGVANKEISRNLWQQEQINSLRYEQQASMSVKNIKVFFQNVWKNNLLTNTILETYISFDVIFIQEPSWTTIHSIPSLKSEDGETLVGVLNHPNWLIFSRTFSSANNSWRVVMYVNIRLSSLCFSFYKDIFNYRDISIVSFFNQNSIFFLINI